MRLPLPYSEPEDAEHGVGDDHGEDAVVARNEDESYLQDNLHYVTPHVDVRPSAAYRQLLIHRVEGKEGTADTQHLKHGYTLSPFLADGEKDKLLRYERQAEEGREGEERREAHQLTEHALLALVVVGDLCQHGLCHLLYRARDGAVCHRVPFVGLSEVSHRRHRELMSDDEGQHVAVDGVYDRGDENLHAEGEHLPDRTEVDVQRGVPLVVGIIIAADVLYQYKEYRLPCQAPVSHAVASQRDAADTRQDERYESRYGALPRHYVLEHVCVVGDAECRDEEAEKYEARQRGEHRRMEIPCYERCAEEENDVYYGADDDVEPEHGVIVVAGRVFDVCQSLRETTALQVAGYEREYCQYAHYAVVTRRQLLRKHDAED